MRYLAAIINGIICGRIAVAIGYEINTWQHWAIFLPLLLWVMLYKDIDDYFKSK